MFRQFESEFVDIFKYPELKIRAEESSQLTLGDLHGNAIKLIYLLIKEGILHISAADYEELVKIYTKNVRSLKAADLTQFSKIISEATVKKHDLLVRLIGDEFADRGSNDYFTLLILKKLYDDKVNCEILLSNHGFEFIKAYETLPTFSSELLGLEFAFSMYGLQALIDKDLLKKEDIIALINEVYKPSLKLLSCSLSKDGEFTLYTHAPVGVEIIEPISLFFDCHPSESSSHALAAWVGEINSKFQDIVRQDDVTKQFLKLKERHGADSDKPQNILKYITCNRSSRPIKRSQQYNDISMIYIHGHDSVFKTELGRCINLDDALGKDCFGYSKNNQRYFYEYNHEGSYRIFVSDDILYHPDDRNELGLSI